ncbi:MAG: ligase-associated DNA damage response exonuclease [Bacteroidales bacterium]
MNHLLQFTDKGIYCQQAGVYIDPWKPVYNALVTHGHSDHARRGHHEYLAHKDAVPVIRYRLGGIRIRGVEYGENIRINGVNFSFHPAGHVPGSAQIRVEHKDEVWVVSGDYKLAGDGISVPFEPVRCHTFITESTFGLPVFHWDDQEVVYNSIRHWWKQNRDNGKTSVLIGYALGKAQHLIKALTGTEGKIFTHGAIENINVVMREQGIPLPETTLVTPETSREEFTGNLVVAPPSELGSPWMKKFLPYATAMASGWMALRGMRRRRSVDRGFVLSDHADWEGLNRAVEATGAENVIATHGYADIFVRWLREKGLNAMTEQTRFEGETILGEEES